MPFVPFMLFLFPAFRKAAQGRDREWWARVACAAAPSESKLDVDTWPAHRSGGTMRYRRSALGITLVLGIFVAVPIALHAQQPARGAAPASQRFDLLITGGQVYDGTGNPWFYADVGIRAGRIAVIGKLTGATATRVIDAKGRVVVPGFIDLHSHADDGASARGGFRDPDPKRRAAPNLVAQGVTTVVVNHDGRSPLPISAQRTFIEKN